MIPNHPRFLEALNEKKKVRVRLYSVADNGVVDRICAPMSYGLGVANQDGLNRYWLWDYASKTGSHILAACRAWKMILRVRLQCRLRMLSGEPVFLTRRSGSGLCAAVSPGFSPRAAPFLHFHPGPARLLSANSRWRL